MKTLLAIDPGTSGGLAIRWFGKTDSWAMPETQGDLLERLRDIKMVAGIEGDEVMCVLEEVGGFAGKAQPGSAMFRFGEHFGFIKGVIQALGIRLVLVRPQAWQKGFGLGTASGCGSKSEWKNKLKAEAQRRFPQLKVTLKTADALLILEYALGREFGMRSSEFGVDHEAHETREKDLTGGNRDNGGPCGRPPDGSNETNGGAKA